jgi:hypothetical protein
MDFYLYKNPSVNVPGGDDYKTEDEALRFTSKPTKMDAPKENFTIEFDKIKDAGADLFLAWENTRVAFNIDVNTDAKVVANINAVMAGLPATITWLLLIIMLVQAKMSIKQLNGHPKQSVWAQMNIGSLDNIAWSWLKLEKYLKQ